MGIENTDHAVFGDAVDKAEGLSVEEQRRIGAAVAGVDPDAWENEEDQDIPADLKADLESGAASVLFWRALIMPVRPRSKSKGGLILVEESQQAQQYLTYIGKVIALGPLWCRGPSFEQYIDGWQQSQMNHRSFFSWLLNRPAVKLGAKVRNEGLVQVGDWVIYGRHAGQRVEYKGVKLLLVNDDEKLMKIGSPEGWRIYG